MMSVAVMLSGCGGCDVGIEPAEPQGGQPPKTSNEEPLTEPSSLRFGVLPADSTRTIIGSGYDVTGAYLSSECLRKPVVDLRSLTDGMLVTLVGTSVGGRFVSYGKPVEFLRKIMTDGDFKAESHPSEYEDEEDEMEYINGDKPAKRDEARVYPEDLYFCGTFTDDSIYRAAEERQPKYTFMMYMDEGQWLIRRINQLSLTRHPDRYLTADFRQALQTESGAKIVRQYGTHVLCSANLGYSIQYLYRSGLKTNENIEHLTYAMYNMMRSLGLHTAIGMYGESTQGGNLSVLFQGADTQIFGDTTPELSTSAHLKSVCERWEQSSSIANSTALLSLKARDLIPIYELVTDKAKRAEIRQAMIDYIHSRQL